MSVTFNSQLFDLGVGGGRFVFNGVFIKLLFAPTS
jgi:hypothetical protein